MLNGELVPADRATVSVWDAGFTLGDGLFETVGVRDGRVVALEAHLARLDLGATALGIPTPAPAELAREVASLLASADTTCTADGVLRLQVTTGAFGTGATRVITLRPAGERELARRLGLELHAIDNARGAVGGFGGHKTSSWIVSAASRRIHPRGAEPSFEGLFVADGAVLEGATSAIGALFGRTLVLPPLDGRILASITRARAVVALDELGLSADVRPLDVDDLRRADAVLALNALLPVAPCIALDGVPLPRSPVVDALRAALW